MRLVIRGSGRRVGALDLASERGHKLDWTAPSSEVGERMAVRPFTASPSRRTAAASHVAVMAALSKHTADACDLSSSEGSGFAAIVRSSRS